MQTIRVIGGGLLAEKIFYASYESLRSRFGKEFHEDEKFWFLDEAVLFFPDLTIEFDKNGNVKTVCHQSDLHGVYEETFHVDSDDLNILREMTK